MISLKLGLRNIWKNRRRSFTTLLAVAIGFTAINLFAGYIHSVYTGIKKIAIHGEALGHLTVVKRGYYTEGKLHPEKYMLGKADLDKAMALIRAEPGVRLVSPRLSLAGLVSNGRASTIFLAEGEIPEDSVKIRTGSVRTPPSMLNRDLPNAGLLSSDLANLLGVKKGQTVVLMSSTLEGQTNALDLEVQDTFNTGNAATNDKFALLPFAYAQSLVDTQGASRVTVLLDPAHDDANAMRQRLLQKLNAAGLDVEIKTWLDLSLFYKQVKNMFDLIFLFLFTIVFIVVLMSITNTMTTSVLERTREIGTLRSLGMKRRKIMELFAVEGAMLGLFGCVLGLLLTWLGTVAVRAANIRYIPPSSSDEVPLWVNFVPEMQLGSLLLLALVAMLAALLPARRAARTEIVDALGHV